MMIKRIFLTLVPVLVFTTTIFGNAAQPGIRMAGGTGSFTLLFPEDSLAFKKIQMQRENINIHLYPGFAVVKGTYWMNNTTGDTITMRTGYPVNAHFSTTKNASDLTEIFFDELYKMSVSINGKPVPFDLLEYESHDRRIFPVNYEGPARWNIWNTTFPPGETVIEVYFMVNTNDSTVSEGYDKARPNGFIYVLETGASWKPPIGEGRIRIQLMGDLTLEDINGVSPQSVLNYSRTFHYLVYRFENLVPDHEDNLVITYGKRLEDFDFAGITGESQTYFSALDKLDDLEADADAEPMDFSSPFDVPGSGSFIVGLMMFVVLYGLPILGLIFLGLLVWWFVKRRRKKD